MSVTWLGLWEQTYRQQVESLDYGYQKYGYPKKPNKKPFFEKIKEWFKKLFEEDKK